MFELFAITEFLESAKLHWSIALFGAALGFWAGTKMRNVTGETGLPGIGAVAGAVLFYVLAKWIAATAVFVIAAAIIILLIVSWPTVSKVIVTFAERIALLLPTSFRVRSFQKQLAAEQRRLEVELENARSLNIDSKVKERIIEKLQNESRDRMLKLSDRSKSNRP